VAGGGAAAAPAPSDLGRQPGLPAHRGGLRPAPHRAPGVHGGALHRGRPGRGVLAAAAAVDALDLVRVPGPPARLLGLAARPGLDRPLSTAPQEPAADRAARRGQALGAEEPEPPVRARRAARRLPGRARDPDPPGAADRDRLGLQPGRAGVGGLVRRLRRPRARPRPARAVGVRPRAVHRRARRPRPGPVPRRVVPRPGGGPGRHRGGDLRALRSRAQRRRRRRDPRARGRPGASRPGVGRPCAPGAHVHAGRIRPDGRAGGRAVRPQTRPNRASVRFDQAVLP
jgi:hypothetical protein